MPTGANQAVGFIRCCHAFTAFFSERIKVNGIRVDIHLYERGATKEREATHMAIWADALSGDGFSNAVKNALAEESKARLAVHHALYELYPGHMTLDLPVIDLQS
jgi:hypothetical protein